MILQDKIKIVSLDEMSVTELQQLDIRIRTLLQCIERTIPGSRNFGLKGDFLDEPVNEAANSMIAELQEKMDIYIPEVTVRNISTDYDTTGRLQIEIMIERSRT